VPAERRGTLIALADAGGADGASAATGGSYRFDIRLQGENETVFLDFDA
jgi:protocatechuate 3,4-dioxygenase alpha subunit